MSSSLSNSDKSTTNSTPATYKWQIDNFGNVTASKFAETVNFYPPYYEKGIFYQLLLHPKVIMYAHEMDHVVVGFALHSSGSAQFPLTVQYQLSILDAKGVKRNTRDRIAKFTKDNSVDTQFNVNWNYLINPANGLLVNGKVTIYCEANLLDTKSITPTLDSNISQDYCSLFENGKFADVTLIVEEKEYKAHKVVLAARSPVFCAMFEHLDTKESQENRVEIDDMAVEVFEQLLRFIYTDKVTDSLDKYAAELFQAADKYQIDSLKLYCEQYLCSSLTIESLANCAVIADMHGAKKLEKQCVEYLLNCGVNAKEVLKTDGWNNLVEVRPNLAFHLFHYLIDKIV